ncbi:MAG TPA: hypothetical protein EYP86_03545 [Candidatus Altiarchaeales archaeon]|nr:hypothetical protein [Candidatus Altiarchaeales archaeon]
MRITTISFFLVISCISWVLLDGFILRNYISLIPLLFAIQIFLNDFLESYLFMSVRGRLFSFLIAPGTIMHEISHYVAAKLMGCKITRISLFHTDSTMGTLGSVEYRYKENMLSPIKSLIIGFAPFFGCGLILIALFNFYYLNTEGNFLTAEIVNVDNMQEIKDSFVLIIESFYSQFLKIDSLRPLFIIVLYLQICLGLGVAPSSTDFKGSLKSLIRHPIGTLILIILLIALVFLTEKSMMLGDYGSILSVNIILTMKWIVLLSLVSISLLIASIPFIFIGIKFLENSWAFRLISLLLCISVYMLSRDIKVAGLIFILAILLPRYSGIFLKKRRDSLGGK